MTICAQCRFLHGEAKGARWWAWLCSAAPIEVHVNPVSGDMTEPFTRCAKLNFGECEKYQAGPNILHPAVVSNGND